MASYAGSCREPNQTQDDALLPELLEHIREPTAPRAGGASAWLEALASRLQEHNFFLLRDDSTAVMTTRGSRPGSSWADLIFAALIGRIIERRNALRAASKQLSRPPRLPWDGCRSLSPCASTSPLLEVQEVIWADDVAVPRVTEAAQAAPAVSEEAGFLTDSFKEFGFSLAYGPHKTAGLLTVRGKDSRRTKQALFGPAGLRGHIPVLLEHPPSVNLPLVTTYRHLGSQQATAGGPRAEICYRISQARAAFAEGRRKYTAILVSLCAVKPTCWAPLLSHDLCSGPDHGVPYSKASFACLLAHFGPSTEPFWGFLGMVINISTLLRVLLFSSSRAHPRCLDTRG